MQMMLWTVSRAKGAKNAKACVVISTPWNDNAQSKVVRYLQRIPRGEILDPSHSLGMTDFGATLGSWSWRDNMFLMLEIILTRRRVGIQI
jgi:hypothetical protein